MRYSYSSSKYVLDKYLETYCENYLILPHEAGRTCHCDKFSKLRYENAPKVIRYVTTVLDLRSNFKTSMNFGSMLIMKPNLSSFTVNSKGTESNYIWEEKVEV